MTSHEFNGASMGNSSGNGNTRNTLKLEGKFGGTQLHTYAKRCQWSLLLASATNELLHTLDENNRTPLHYAIENGAEIDVVLELIRIGPFQVRVKDDAKETPLHIGCEYGIGLIVVHSILQADVQHGRGRPSILTLKNSNGKTPLDIIRDHNVKDSYQPLNKETTVHSFFTSIRKLFSLLPWKYYRNEYDGVLKALEETQRGDAGVAGLAY